MESKIITFGETPEQQIKINTEKTDYLDMLPKEAEPLIESILMLSRGNKRKDAERGLDMLIMQYPKNPEIKAFAALSYFHVGKKQKALELIEQNYQQEPENILNRCAFARIEIMSNNPGAVSRIFNNDFRVIEPNKGKTIFLAEFYELLYTFGLFFCSIGDKDNAIAYLENLRATAHPENPLLHELKELCCKRFGYCLHKKDGEQDAESSSEHAASAKHAVEQNK